MLIDKKIYDLMDYLIKNEEPSTITNIAKKLNQNRRVIYYNLDKINEVIERSSIEKIVNKNKFGVLLTYEQKEFFKNLLADYDRTIYFLDIDERKLFISILISAYPRKITIDYLMNACYVSRNTIVNDIKDIKKTINNLEYNVTLEVTKREGYFLLGDSLDRIQYTYYLLNEIYLSNNEKLKKYISSIFDKEDDIFTKEFKKKLETSIDDNIEILGKTISTLEKKKFIFSFPYILYANRKIDNINKLDIETHPVINRVEYKFIEKIVSELEKSYELYITKKEKILLAIIVLCLKKDFDIHNYSGDYKVLMKNVNTLVTIFENNSGVKFEERNSFINKLVTHFKALLFRKEYNIVTNCNLANKIVNNYKEIFLVTKLSVKYLESVYSIKFSTAEIAYISLHFGAELINTKQKIKKVKRVLIVTDEASSIQKLIEKQCKYYLSNCMIVAVVQDEEINNYKDIDFIITTNFLNTSIPTVRISPLMTIEDINKIMNFIMNIRGNYNEYIEEKMDKLISDYILNEEKASDFKFKLKKLFNSNVKLNGTKNFEVSLKEVVDEDKIIISEQIDDINEIVERLGSILIENNSISRKNIENLKNRIDEDRIYTSLFDKICMIGTKGSAERNKADLALMYLKNPIKLDNADYKLIFFISTIDNMEHLRIIYDINELINKHNILEKFEENLSPKMITNYIKEKL